MWTIITIQKSHHNKLVTHKKYTRWVFVVQTVTTEKDSLIKNICFKQEFQNHTCMDKRKGSELLTEQDLFKF